MSKALLVGSFDPPTFGHLDLIERGSSLCSQLFVGIGTNSAKLNLLSHDERLDLLKLLTKKHKNVEIVDIKGLTIQFAQEKGIDFLLRGVRSSRDLDFELQLAAANKTLSGIETLFLSCDPKYSFQSSTLIREIASSGRSLEKFVPAEVETLLKMKTR